jgi:hypothetical protein
LHPQKPKGEASMKRFAMAIALAFVLSGVVLAGDMPTGDYAPPAPDDPSQTTTPTAPGEVPSGGYTQEGSTEITLTVVQAILSLLSV